MATSTDVDQGGAMAEEDSTLGRVPRYALPNIASILPEYSNAEQDVVRRAFANGSYDTLHNLPTHLKVHEVNKVRAATMDAARKPLVQGEGGAGTGAPLRAPVSNTGLFQEFEYMPSRYSIPEELQTIERLENESKRMALGGQEFVPAGTVTRLKSDDGFEEGKRYPYQSDLYEAATDLMLRHKWLEESKVLSGPMVPSGTDKALAAGPTKLVTREMIQQLHKIICQDWEEAEVSIYANDDEHWVIRFNLDTIDSEPGLVTYMNVMLRTNSLVLKYQLAKVVEQWDVKPGDGSIYFTVRPPWVKAAPVEAFYSLHPEHRIYAGTAKPDAKA